MAERVWKLRIRLDALEDLLDDARWYHHCQLVVEEDVLFARAALGASHLGRVGEGNGGGRRAGVEIRAPRRWGSFRS